METTNICSLPESGQFQSLFDRIVYESDKDVCLINTRRGFSFAWAISKDPVSICKGSGFHTVFLGFDTEQRPLFWMSKFTSIQRPNDCHSFEFYPFSVRELAIITMLTKPSIIETVGKIQNLAFSSLALQHSSNSEAIDHNRKRISFDDILSGFAIKNSSQYVAPHDLNSLSPFYEKSLQEEANMATLVLSGPHPYIKTSERASIKKIEKLSKKELKQISLALESEQHSSKVKIIPPICRIQNYPISIRSFSHILSNPLPDFKKCPSRISLKLICFKKITEMIRSISKMDEVIDLYAEFTELDIDCNASIQSELITKFICLHELDGLTLFPWQDCEKLKLRTLIHLILKTIDFIGIRRPHQEDFCRNNIDLIRFLEIALDKTSCSKNNSCGKCQGCVTEAMQRHLLMKIDALIINNGLCEVLFSHICFENGSQEFPCVYRYLIKKASKHSLIELTGMNIKIGSVFWHDILDSQKPIEVQDLMDELNLDDFNENDTLEEDDQEDSLSEDTE
jgi:hypothetical protein